MGRAGFRNLLAAVFGVSDQPRYMAVRCNKNVTVLAISGQHRHLTPPTLNRRNSFDINTLDHQPNISPTRLSQVRVLVGVIGDPAWCCTHSHRTAQRLLPAALVASCAVRCETVRLSAAPYPAAPQLHRILQRLPNWPW